MRITIIATGGTIASTIGVDGGPSPDVDAEMLLAEIALEVRGRE